MTCKASMESNINTKVIRNSFDEPKIIEVTLLFTNLFQIVIYL